MTRRLPLNRERAWTYLLDLLTRRDYTEAELRDRLRRRGVGDDDADGLLARLRELGLADDARFAEQYVASRRGSRGRLALRAELRRKGVEASLVERELDPLSEAQQVAAATALLQRNAWRYRPGSSAPRAAGGKALPPGGDASASADLAPEDEGDPGSEAEARRRALKERARAFAFLARRGFTADVATAAIHELGWWLEGG